MTGGSYERTDGIRMWLSCGWVNSKAEAEECQLGTHEKRAEWSVVHSIR